MVTTEVIQWKLICRVNGEAYNKIFNKFSEVQAFLNKARSTYKVTEVIICEV